MRNMEIEKSLQSRGSSSISEEDFDSLIQKNLPTWNATWNMLLQANLESSRVKGRPETTELHKRIRRKITELVDEEEALVDLYTKAAEAAKEREMTFRNKTAILTEQIKKDKNLMKILKRS